MSTRCDWNRYQETGNLLVEHKFMDTVSKLFNIADELEKTAEKVPEDELDKIESVGEEFGKSWSGSFLGYHSRVYYKNFILQYKHNDWIPSA